MASNRKHRDALPQGAKLLWYEVQSVIGQGGFGITYLARDTNLDQAVAIKEYLPTEFAHRDEDSTVRPLTGEHGELYRWGLDRFLTEAKTLAQFKHPNIVRVLSVFELHNSAYMVMEYERGEELGDRFKRGELRSERELLDTLLPVMDGLRRVHEAGFIHRDIKPANIYIRENDSAVLLDFGSARQAIGQQTKALTSLVTGGYAPFEQYHDEGGRQGPWTDIYAFGATLYKAITDQLPVDALVRGTAVINDEVDPYIPAVGIGGDRYSKAFLEAVDCGLRFREKDRPQSIVEWIPMLTGEIGVRPERAQTTAPSQEQKKFLETVRMNRPPRRVRSGRTDSRADGADAELAAAGSAESNTIESPSSSDPATPPEPGPATAWADAVAPTEYARSDRRPPVSPSAGRSRFAVFGVAGAVLAIMLAVLAFILFDKPPPAPAAEPAKPPSVATPQPSVDAEAQRLARQIAALLDEARTYLDRDQLDAPADANALDRYRQVLRLDPGNRAAVDGLQIIRRQLTDAAETAIAETRLEDAETAVDRLLKAFPGDSVGIQLGTRVLAAREARLQDRQRRMAESESLQQARARLTRLLEFALQHLSEGRLVEPAGRNALDIYRQVLATDSDNQPAREGIARIAVRLTDDARSAIDADEYDRAESLIASLRKVAPGSPEARQLDGLLAERRAAQLAAARQREAERLARQLEEREARQIRDRITALLANALVNLKANRLTRPDTNNAVKDYRDVLAIEPDNRIARDGLSTVAEKYAELADSATRRGEFDRAESLLDSADGVFQGSSAVATARRNLASLRNAAELARIRELEAARASREAEIRRREAQQRDGRSDVEVVGEILQEFHAAFSSRDLARLERVSDMSDRRRAFLAALFAEYPTIDFVISNFSLLDAQDLSHADFSITNLVNRDGDKVVPGSWKDARLQINRVDGLWGKVRW